MSLPKTDFGPPPPNYVAGLARGAVGFITRLDIGPANYTPYDQWGGYQESIFNGEKYDDEDKEADIMYRHVDQHMEGRRRKQIEIKEKEEAQKMLDKNPTLAFQFADLKRGLGAITADEWNMIPEAQDYSIKKQKNDKYTPVPDHIIEGARREGAMVSHVDVNGLSTPLHLNDIGKANMTVLTAKLDKSTDQVSGFTTLDKSGYLTGLNSQVITTSADIGDVKRARKLMLDMINTDPKNLNGWIGLARVEEIDGKMQQARNVLYQGLQHCQRHEDIWIEISRFETPEKGKAILAQAALILPKSLKIWMAAADLEQLVENKVKVLRKALDHIADQPKLWNKLIDYVKEAEAKVLLYKAVECIPGDLDMWLALAKLETYENAKAVLNRARKALPQEPAIWINAAKLEETQGSSQEKITKILQVAIATYQKMKYNINKDDWLEEAARSEKSGNPLTCVAIVRAIILHDIFDTSDQERVLLEEAKRMVDAGCLGTARAVFEFGVEAFAPNNVMIIQQTINFEVNTGKDFVNLEKLYKLATTQHSTYEIFWIQRIQFHWNQAKKSIELNSRTSQAVGTQSAIQEAAKKADELRNSVKGLFEEAQRNLPENEQILMLSVKFLKESNQIDAARDLIEVAKKAFPSAKTFIASMKLEFQAGQLQKANADAVSAMSAFPNEEKIFIQAAKIANRYKSIEQARAVFEKGIRFNPMSVLLITRYVEFEISHGFFPRARPILEKFRVKLPKCPELWVTAVQLEIEAENKKGARYMLARAQKECPEYNQLWSYAIELEPKATRKKKILEALDKCRQDPYVNISVAKLFWKERKMEKARKWIEKSTFERPEIIDSWAALYLFELEEAGKEKAQSILAQAKAVDSTRQGRLFSKIKKQDDSWNLSFDQVFIKITEAIKKELINIE